MKIQTLFKKMKHKIGFVHSILIIVLFLTIGYLILLLNGIIPSVNPHKGVPKYSDETGMVVILTFIGIVFALFSFLTFQSVSSFFDSKVSEIVDKQNKRDREQEEQWIKHKQEFNNLIGEVETREGLRCLEIASASLSRNEYDWYVQYMLLSLSCFAKRFAIEKSKEGTEGLQSTLLEGAITDLNNMLSNLEHQNNIVDKSSVVTEDCIKKIRKFESLEIDSKVMLIYNKLVQESN